MAESIDRDELVAYLDKLLEVSRGQDYCPNGLQVEGRGLVRRIVTGVSACRELFAEARRLKADAVLVHHGIFWKGASPTLVGVQYGRVRELILGELNLLAYHLPLDRHPELGNNALAARNFGLVELEPFAFHAGEPTGYAGRFPEPIAAEVLVRRAEEIYERKPLVYSYGPERVRNLAIVSGGAQKELYGAIDAGYDAFLTGEVSEWVMNLAREARVHYLAAGHYATERCGVRALGKHLAERFGLEVEYVDVPNPA